MPRDARCVHRASTWYCTVGMYTILVIYTLPFCSFLRQEGPLWGLWAGSSEARAVSDSVRSVQLVRGVPQCCCPCGWLFSLIHNSFPLIAL